MDKQGLVAPVWSDSGEVGEVTYNYSGDPVLVSFDECGSGSEDQTAISYGTPIPTAWNQPREANRIIWTSEPCKWDLRDDRTIADCVEKFDRQIQKPSHTVTVNITNTKEWKSREEWESILRAWVRKEIVPQALEILPGLIGKAPAKATKPADPNAKHSLPSLAREGGNKRGPGWCDE